jgi:hypothetical protein
MQKLEKRYLYLPSISRVKKVSNVYNLIKGIDNKSILEEVSIFDSKLIKSNNDLHRLKVETMKELILNQRKIPEQWIFQKDYQQILNEAMQDPTVLTYSIICQDLYKKRRDGFSYEDIINKERAKSHYVKSEGNIKMSDNFIRRLKYEESIKNLKKDNLRKNNFNKKNLDLKIKKNGSEINLRSINNNNKGGEFLLTSLENNPILN